VQRSPATPALLRELNERTVLEAIRAEQPISRADVARRAGLSKPTVSLALQSLLDAGLVREVGVSSGRPGRGALLFEPVAEAAYVLGLDIGGRFLRAAVADLDGEVRAREDVALEVPTFAAVLDAADGLRRRLERAAGADGRIVAAICGAPAVIDPATGRAWLAGAVSDIEGLDVGAAIGERLGVEVQAENDVNLAALGERWRGHGQGVRDFAFVSIGTGMGAAIVFGGELHRGFRGAAGEIDQVPLRRAAGSLDPTAVDPSADGLAALVAELGGPADLRRSRDLRPLFEAARHGDPLAQRVVETAARWIAWYVASIAAVVDPELVVLGGGIGANADLLLGPVRDELATLLARPPRVEVSRLGDGAVLAGALALARRAALDHVFVNRLVPQRSNA
jgi:predicted NBD/HSP70 family sugar kinase